MVAKHMLLESMDVNVYPRLPIAEVFPKDLATIGIDVEVKFCSGPNFEGQDCSGLWHERRLDPGLLGRCGLRWGECEGRRDLNSGEADDLARKTEITRQEQWGQGST